MVGAQRLSKDARTDARAFRLCGDGGRCLRRWQNHRRSEAGEKWIAPLEAGDRAELRARINAALARLKRDPRVDPARTAAIGYCFGGATVLELARSGAAVNGVVSFHGHYDTGAPARPGDVKARILVCHGADDPFTSQAQIAAFEDEMRKARADWQFNVYGGAEHSFTNPNADAYHVSGIAYDAQADHRSWQAMKDFFKEIFR